MNPFNIFFPKKVVGVDIGTASIKVVELSRFGQGKNLENYGQVQSSSLYREPVQDGDRKTGLLDRDVVADAIKGILSEAKIKTRAAVFSIPDFSTFCTSFELPKMPEREIADAVYYNASQYITLPISEVALDWHIIPNHGKNGSLLQKVFLVAIPNQVVQEYKTIAKLAGLELHALEAEALGITRSLVGARKKTVCVIDIGVQSSTINIVDEGFLTRSYSFNFYSGQLSQAVASALGISYEQAEEIKNKEGLVSTRPQVAKTLYLLIDPLLARIRGLCAEFTQSEQREVEEIYLTGGTANLPGLREYCQESLKKTTVVPNCFLDFLYPPILEDTLRGMAPGYSAAVGVALSRLED